jgi:hypothetical protein
MRFWRVDEIESEAGWGSKIDSTSYYDVEKKARDHAHRINKLNTAASAPSYYCRADVTIVDVDDELVDLIKKVKKAKKVTRKGKKS